MTYRSQPEGWPPHHEDGHLQWSFPSGCWSGEKYGEDMIKVTLDVEGREWWAYTEMDQCVKRDLDDSDIEEIRKECGLDAWVTYHYPDYFKDAAPNP
jgi:hypothetical protein